MTGRQQQTTPTAQPRWSWGHHATPTAPSLAAQPRWSWG